MPPEIVEAIGPDSAQGDHANLRGVPHHGIGRGFKAGKEEIIGLLTVLDRFAKADDAADNAPSRSGFLDERMDSDHHLTR